MAVACGTDIIYIPGLQKIIKDEAMLDKFFDPKELIRTTSEHLAGIIAAKEAFFKALGVFPKFREVQIAYEKSGKPKLIVSPKFQTFTSCDVSISHDNDYAIAMVVLEI
jgi:phosphopantetheine--protein transferase-like protein